MENILKDKSNIAIIVAHHDDETLFCGGLLEYLYDNNYKPTIIIITDIKTENIKFNCETKYINFKSIMEKFNFKYIELNIQNYESSDKNNIIYIKEQINNLKKEYLLIKNNKCIKDEFNDLILLQKKYNKLKIYHKKILKSKKKNDKLLKKIKNNKSIIKDKLIIQKKIYKNIYYNYKNIIKDKIDEYKFDLLLKTEDYKKTALNILDNDINYKTIYDLIKNSLEKYINNYDLIITHNNKGEYGNIQHIITHTVIRDNFDKDNIICFSNEFSELKLKINITNKHSLIKMYTFKDTINNNNIWYNQCLNNYTFWSNTDYEYYNRLE